MLSPKRFEELRGTIAACAHGAVDEAHLRAVEAMTAKNIKSNEEATTCVLVGLASAFHAACVQYGHVNKTGVIDPVEVLSATIEMNKQQIKINRKAVN
jgi:hypothetical protein